MRRNFELKRVSSMRSATVTRQLANSINFRQNYLCDFHLRSLSARLEELSGGESGSDTAPCITPPVFLSKILSTEEEKKRVGASAAEKSAPTFCPPMPRAPLMAASQLFNENNTGGV